MLIQHPHDLTGIHGGAAADGKNQVRLEGRHLGSTFPGAGQGGVGGHIVEGGMADAHFVQLLLDGPGVAVVVQEGVRNDEGLLVRLQLSQSHRQAALFEINLFRCTEPKHILPPNGNGFDIQQMLNAHILRNGVAAPASAAQGQGGGQLEIVQVANAALGRGGIDQDPAGLHGVSKGIQLFSVIHLV